MSVSFRFWLLWVIFLEGYAVLSSEILVIRQLVPFVGNGLESISIVISAVLIPLSFGYYAGGNYKGNVRSRLVKNLLQANILLILALSYNLLEVYFTIFTVLGINNHALQSCLFSVIFLIYPIFLLGQTIPLISHYFQNKKLSSITGKILFISTLGSFFGSILSTLLFMPFIGVNNTVIVTIFSIALAVLVIEKSIISYNCAISVFSVIVCLLLNYPQYDIVSNNAYSTIQIIEDQEEESKIMSINRSSSAKIVQNPKDRFEYLKFIDERFLEPLLNDQGQSKQILVIGAGGFTFGLQDKKNDYTYVDIDKSLKQIAEEYFLLEPLSANKTFVAKPARTVVRNHDKKYDLIFLDVYTHYLSIPFQLITEEFFYNIKVMLKKNGVLLFNAILSPSFADDFSVKLDNTLHKHFSHCNREVIGSYDGWQNGNAVNNVIYSCFNITNTKTYSDNNNSYFLDKAT